MATTAAVVAAAEADAAGEAGAEGPGWLAAALRHTRGWMYGVDTRWATAVAVAAVMLVACGKNLLSKLSIEATASVAGGVKETTGWAYSSFSCLVTMVWTQLLFIGKPSLYRGKVPPFSLTFTAVVVFSIADVGLSNAALAAMDLPVHQAVKAATPVLTALIESVLRAEVRQPWVYAAALAVSAGACLVTLAGATSAPLAPGGGAVLMTIAALLSATRYVLLRQLLIWYRGRLGSVGLLFWVDFFGFLAISAIAMASGEMLTFVRSLIRSSAAQNLGTFVSAALGGVRFLVEVLALRFMLASDLSVVTTLASMLSVVASMALGRPYLSGEMLAHGLPMLIPGVVLIFAGLGAYYALLRHYGDNIVYHKAPAGMACLDDEQGEALAARFSDDMCDEGSVCATCAADQSRACCCAQYCLPLCIGAGGRAGSKEGGAPTEADEQLRYFRS